MEAFQSLEALNRERERESVAKPYHKISCAIFSASEIFLRLNLLTFSYRKKVESCRQWDGGVE